MMSRTTSTAVQELVARLYDTTSTLFQYRFTDSPALGMDVSLAFRIDYIHKIPPSPHNSKPTNVTFTANGRPDRIWSRGVPWPSLLKNQSWVVECLTFRHGSLPQSSSRFKESPTSDQVLIIWHIQRFILGYVDCLLHWAQ